MVYQRRLPAEHGSPRVAGSFPVDSSKCDYHLSVTKTNHPEYFVEAISVFTLNTGEKVFHLVPLTYCNVF